jgi:hypothetical protein
MKYSPTATFLVLLESAMSESMKKTTFLKGRIAKCPHCGAICPPQVTQCPECHKAVDTSTEQIERRPILVPIETQGTERFEDDYVAVLQFLPSGTCISMSMEQPLILGRGATPESSNFLDLTHYNALKHGVSRRHCQLQRREHRLIVTDLGSSNYTYVNNERILPYQDQLIADGDRLIVGTLHIRIFFSPLPLPLHSG